MSASARIVMALIVMFVLTAIPYLLARTHGKDEFERLQAQVQKMEGDNASIRAGNQQLSERIKAFRTDPALIERRARERLQLARPDELIIVFDAGNTEVPTVENE